MPAIIRVKWRCLATVSILLCILMLRVEFPSYAQDSSWSIVIVNKSDPEDYPLSVYAGQVFDIIVRANVTVPAGKMGTINIFASTGVYPDPMPPRLVRLVPEIQTYSQECAEGTHSFGFAFTFSAPDVKRESWVQLMITAELYDGSNWEDFDGFDAKLAIHPSDDVAVDFRFKGVVENVFKVFDVFLYSADIIVTEVLDDPGDFWIAGYYVWVFFDDGPLIENVTIGDSVEVYCDYHADHYPKGMIWQPHHYIVIEFLHTDLNKDGIVDIQDITIVAVAYKASPGDPRWNPIADVDKNSTIDILDIAKVAKDYGKTV